MNKSIKDHIIESLDNLVEEKLNRFKSKLCEGEDKFPKGKVDKYDSAELVDYMISCYTETHAAQKIIQILEAINQKDTAEMLKEKIQHEPPPPGEIKIDSMTIDSVSLSWGKPDGMGKIPHSFNIAYISSDKSHQDSTTATSNSKDITKLRPGREYTFTVTTVLKNGSQSIPVSTTACTEPPPPGEIKIDSMTIDSVSLSWGKPDGMGKIPHSFNIAYISSDKSHQDSTTATSNSKDITKLRPGREYTFTVTTVLKNGSQSIPVSTTACTEPPPPGEIKIDSMTIDSVSLSWGKPDGMGKIPHSFNIAYISSDKSHQDSTTATSNSKDITKLRPGREYTFTVTTVLKNGSQSIPVSTTACTETHLKDLLYKLGLENYYPSKIKLSTVLEIGTESITDEPIQSLHKLPWCFLKRLMMVNVTARNSKGSAVETETDTTAQDLDSIFERMADNDTDEKDSNQINPSDIITALFLCSDSFLQQEMMLKMSMCQFAVPLLLQNCDTNQCTLMLWAMQDIVKKFRPHSLADSKGFVEDRIVSIAMPMISFVRLGDCSLSKSQILNQVLSNPQQYHDFFIHRNMECGDVTRRISNGLVEIGWYLPSGKLGLDVFPKPVAVVNLHGDISSFQTQFSILGATSSAVFIVFDSIAESEYDFLSSIRNIKAQLFLVVNCQKKTEKNINSPKDLASKLKLNGKHIIFKNKQINDADFVNKLRSTMNDIIVNSPQSMTVEDMSAVAHELGINVDEDCDECQNAKESAKEITSRINDVGQYKEKQLPLQGKPWKELAKKEKEECRLRKAGDQPIEAYKNDLQKEKQKLRQEQIRYNLSEAMQCFITAISNSNKEERSYFLKWMRMNLDVAARAQLSGLRDQYKEKCSKPSKNKQIIADLDRQISNCSLGVEHFMREMGQLYEASCHIPASDPSHDQFQHLPGLAADLLLDGFPLELVDGDASNIPVRWVTDVLTELHEKVQCKSRVLVVTVLGVQSTGKSTLLNTMFGVQFAVSSGRCTRGAFMLLIRVKEDIKEKLNCDFILVIDTEGLKSPELAQLDDSYEHDNELATLVVGLSDITIINIEASCHIPASDPSHDQFQHLPGLAADLLLDGFPLELVDGDASNIPVRWVTDVLTELHEKVQHKSRLLVVTVLGVQSTGKSTLLNTMFGVQFAVSSGRCTRGAFMLLIRVKEDIKEKLNCDFILVIDTEGLKSPELAQLDDSYEHDNELATLVVGLSDITIINIAMENSTEMKDILQIVVHAFLRMDKVGKKPKCYFVHQNVGDVSAHDNNMRDRKMLLEQLNEMTEAAARMEKQDINRKFTDIMEYDPEKNNWYIPSLWQGNPPMAPVNSGYSEAVYEFKKSLIEVLKSCNDQKPPAQIKEFLEWVESLWKAVKYENFIFSFRNSLVAEAYSNLCVEYNDWEWAFKKHMHNWLTNVETRISNTNNQSTLDLFFKDLKDEAYRELIAQEKIALDKLTEYYERKDGHVNLVESYRAVFEKSINTLKIEIENSLTRKCKAAIDFQKGKLKVRDINLKHKSVLEKKVLQVLEGCRESNVGLSDEELTEEFEKMWKETVSELNFIGLQKRDIGSNVLNQLRKQLGRHVGAVTKVLNETSGLTNYGTTEFKVTSTHLHRAFFEQITDYFRKTNHIEETNKMAQSIIAQSRQFVASKNNRTTDYHETYTGELLEMIDQKLKEIEKPKTNAQFEVDLKLHICGFAAKAFQQMHENFIEDNNPRKHLEKSKPQYCSDFIDLFHEKDQCEKKAEKFTQRCLEPAVRDYVIKALGIDIADEMLTGAHSLKYSTRSTFQHSLLKQMLNEKDFRKYVDYISDYEMFVKNWIFDCILEQFSKDQILSEFEVKRLESITKKIQKAIEEEKKKETSRNGNKTISVFIENVCSTLNSDIVISTDNLGFQGIKDKANTEEFIGHLEYYVDKMKTSLSAEFSQVCDINKKLNSLPFKPQDELFKRVFGCGKQCPFCKVPCEAGGKDHKDHHASVHRPQGLGTYRYVFNKKLTETICTSDVYSEKSFYNLYTVGFHPYKKYREIYPDWIISPDPSIKASDYWKYVLTMFNNEFAKEYNAEPADVPEEWKNITDEQALTSLNQLFNIKT
ncbi:UNVERIFIED_CONTAM: hypothetical protein FKN15_021316 [Acipenser sinensis]